MASLSTNKDSVARGIRLVTTGVAASDGDGVKLRRIIGTPEVDMIDPFLMLDRFGTDEPSDYIGGFPSHPHRGFQTVTYMLAGRMRHKDNAGNEGVIEPGGVQWMTAGRGVVHSEMPEQTEGRMEGFQLWVNLPAAKKMTEPAYQEFPADAVPVEDLVGGGTVHVVAGKSQGGTTGPVSMLNDTPLFLDVRLPPAAAFEQEVPEPYNGFVYVIDGSLTIGDTNVPAGSMGVLGDGKHLRAATDDAAARFLLVAGKAIHEPVAKAGPFVMNTRAELHQAFEDFQNGKF